MFELIKSNWFRTKQFNRLWKNSKKILMAWRKFSIQFRNFPLSSSFYLFLVKANYIFSHCIFLFCVSPQLHIFQNSSFCVCWNYGSAKILFWSLIWDLRVILYQLWAERGQQLITFWPTFLSKNQLSTKHKNHVGLRKKNSFHSCGHYSILILFLLGSQGGVVHVEWIGKVTNERFKLTFQSIYKSSLGYFQHICFIKFNFQIKGKWNSFRDINGERKKMKMKNGRNIELKVKCRTTLGIIQQEGRRIWSYLIGNHRFHFHPQQYPSEMTGYSSIQCWLFIHFNFLLPLFTFCRQPSS